MEGREKNQCLMGIKFEKGNEDGKICKKRKQAHLNVASTNVKMHDITTYMAHSGPNFTNTDKEGCLADGTEVGYKTHTLKVADAKRR